jgi:hypothetical protein
MLTNCRKACDTCKVPTVQIEAMIEKKLAPSEELLNSTELGVAQLTGNVRKDEVEARIANVTNYFHTVVKVDPKYAKVVQDCKYRHENCAFWAVSGEVRTETATDTDTDRLRLVAVIEYSDPCRHEWGVLSHSNSPWCYLFTTLSTKIHI